MKYTLSNGETRYRVRYVKPDNKPTDKRGFRTKAAARAWLHEMEVAKSSGTFVTVTAQRTLMGKLIDEHVGLTVGLSRNTVAQRRSHATNWVLPKWQNWPVGNVNKYAVEQWIQELTEDGAGAETIRKCHQLLVSVMERAVDQNLIARNLVKRVRLPRISTKKHPYLTFDEVAELATEIDPRYRLLVVFLALTGLRFGEAAALRVNSLDLQRRLISVDESVTEVEGVIQFGPTKDHKRRIVAFAEILDHDLAEAVAGKTHDSLVFTSPDGKPLRHTTWRRRFWNPAIHRLTARRVNAASTNAGFPVVTPHDLRHTAASLAIRGGASVVAVQRMLGHADAKMTLNTYAGLFTNDLVDVANVLSASAAMSTLIDVLKTPARSARPGEER